MASINEDPVTVSTDRATVEREVQRKPDGVTAEYTVRAAGTPVEVRVEEEILSGVPEEDIGFHPDQEPEITEIEGGNVAFEATVAPHEAFVTVLGVRTAGEEIDPFVGRPRIARTTSVDPAPEDVDSTSEGEAAEIREGMGEVTFGAGDTDAPFADDAGDDPIGAPVADPDDDLLSHSPAADDPPTDGGDVTGPIGAPTADDAPDGPAENGAAADDADDEAAADDAVIAPPPPEDDGDEAEAEAEETAAGDAEPSPEVEESDAGGTAVTDGAPGAAARGSVVDAIVTEIEAGDADDEQVARLREALGADEVSLRRSDEVRVDRLQSRLEDFAAYADALEGVIDEHGTATEFVDELHEETAALRDDLEAGLDEAAAAREEVRESLEAGLGDAAEEREALREELDAVADDRDEVEERLAALADDLEELQTAHENRIQEFEEELAQFRQLREGLQTAFGGGAGGEPELAEADDEAADEGAVDDGDAA